MKIKGLLGLSMAMGCGVSAQAQTPVFHESFDAAQTKGASEVGYYEFINTEEGDEIKVPAAGAFKGDGCLNMFNFDQPSNDNNFWRRAIKFRNLPLQEGKNYRLTYKVKGTNTFTDANGNATRTKINVALMQGGENADIPLLDAKGNEFRFTESYLNPDNYETYTRMFHFASAQLQKDTYAKNNPDKDPLADTFFATFNVYNPGDFYLDEIDLVESNIADYTAGGYTIRVNFGFGTNIKSLANASSIGRVIMPEGTAAVKVNGAEAKVESVELHNDGFMYIFLEDTEIDKAANIEVTFKNPEAKESQVLYDGALAPEGPVANFTEAFDASYNEDLGQISSFAWEPAKLISATPADHSFAWPETVNEFTLKLDHKIYTVATDDGDGGTIDVPVATLTGVNEKLAIKAGTPELTDEITFVRTGNTPLKKGMYSVVLTGAYSEKKMPSDDITVSFETGEIKLAETTYTDIFTHLLEGEANGQPAGWTIMVGGENFTGGEPKEDNGSACRNQNIQGTDGAQTAFYLCDRDGYTYMMYGDKEDARLSLPAGDIEFTVLGVGHENPSRRIEFRIEDLEGNEIASGSGNTTVQAEQFTSVNALGPISIQFNNPKEQNIVVKIHEPEGGFTACRIVGVKAQSYKVSEGDTSDEKVVLASDFVGGNMPAEGTGWLCYNDNNELAPGSGRNGTSGMLERNFSPKMPSAFFARECGSNDNAGHRIEYGNGNGVEGGFEMEPGSYEIVYYGGTWNDPSGNANGTSKVFMQLLDATDGTVVFSSEHVNKANFENGGACNGQADKVTEKFNCAGGKYIIKAWGTHNTVWGGLTITKEGSYAAKWYGKLREAVEDAKLELESSAAEELDGNTKNALSEAIAKYDKPSGMHEEAEFLAAIDKLNDKASQMKARRDALTNFKSVIGNIAGIVENAEEKYKALESYQILSDINTKYAETNPSDIETEELVPLTQSLQFNYNLYNNMVNTCVGLLTKQINNLVSNIEALQGEEAGNYAEVIAEAKMAVDDNQKLARLLRLIYTQKVYETIAAGNPFVEFDAEGNEDAKTLDAVGYIQNANFYCTQPVKGGDTSADTNAFPGWDIKVTQGGLRSAWTTTWGEKWPTNEKPVEDCGVKAGWGDNEYNVEQVLAELPVAIYQVSVQMGEDGIPTSRQDASIEEVKSFAYVGDVKQTYDGYVDENGDQKQSRDFNHESNTKTFNAVTVAAGEDGILGSLTIGVNMNLKATHGGLDNFNMLMTGAVPGFNYEQAAKDIQKLIDEATSVESVKDAETAKVLQKVYKAFKNGQVVISKDGKKFNAAGVQVK